VLKLWVWPVLGLDAQNTATDIAIAITKIIERDRTFGWHHDRDLQNRIRNAILDFFFVQILAPGAINLGPDVVDMIADDVPASARVRMAEDGRIQLSLSPVGARWSCHFP
jgi:type I restriction enzyme R subunit